MPFVQFKSVYRGIVRSRGMVAINVAGFALAMACCMLIFLFVVDEYSYDRHVPDADRIYRVCLDRVYPERNVMWASIPPAVREGLMSEFPEIEKATHVRREMFQASIEGGVASQEIGIAADTSFFQVFGHSFLSGQPASALSAPNDIVLSKKMAEKFFPGQDPIGKSIAFEHAGLFNVTAVMEDVPEAAHLHYDFIVGFGWDRMTDFHVWDNNFGYYTYVKLQPGSDWKALESKLPAMSRKYISQGFNGYEKWRREGNDYRFFLQPLTDIHLHSNLKWEAEANGDFVYVAIFVGTGLLILAMAVINFVNLATARYSVRAREVGVRKVLGSMRVQLVTQFMFESLVLSTFGIVIALVLVEVALPMVNDLMGKHLSVPYLTHPGVLPALALASFGVGVLAGFYPAIVLSSFKPASVLGHGKVGFANTKFRDRLVVFQFVISFFLIAGSWLVFSQLRFMQSKDLGMTKDQILVINNARLLPNRDVFKNALAAKSGVVGLGYSADIPGRMEGAATFRPKGLGDQQELNMTIIGIDTGIVRTWGLTIADGRNFMYTDYTDTSRNVIVNETAVRMFGWPDDPVGKELTDGGNQVLRIVGVVKDFHVESLHKEIRPTLMLPTADWVNRLSIRLATDPTVRDQGAIHPSEVISAAESLWKEMVPGQPFEYMFLDDHYNALYRAEATTGKLFLALTTMAIVISCLGLFGLSAFMAERRTREIGIRKVVGASTANIVWTLIYDLASLVLLAILVGIPISYFAMKSWLGNFAYRVDISYQPFLLAGSISLTIAVGTVCYHAIRAARVNPTHTLRAQ